MDLTDKGKLRTTREAAEILGLSPPTLETWRTRKSDGPRFVRLGRAIRYRPEDLAIFIERGERSSRSDPGSEAA
ncbi:MAG: helix-turn-helix domain-containing protein [Candidatus Sumerlaeota bacterium]|nr:helix-turn-helix domain-containing protein [Candidatus Sumerlaeota bacterium]